jgi:hypothetical protein
MKRYLSLDPKPHNKLAAEIADTIKEFYPIGIGRESPEYNNHPGVIKMNEIMEDNILNNKNYRERWGTFLRKLRKNLKKSAGDLRSTTYGVGPSFSADLILEQYEDNALTRVKRISFAVSLIAPFYTVYGIDKTFIKDKLNELAAGYGAINVITTSPFMEFENDFNYLQQQIEKQYTGYKFVPITMSLALVKELNHDYLEAAKVHNALFNHLFDRYDTSFGYTRGDSRYGYGESNIKVTLSPPPPSH